MGHARSPARLLQIQGPVILARAPTAPWNGVFGPLVLSGRTVLEYCPVLDTIPSVGDPLDPGGKLLLLVG